jgi:hypothetical protein
MATDREVADPGVLIVLGGRERRLVYTTWAWMQLEKLQQKSLLGKQIEFRSLTDIIHFAWAGLLAHQKDLDGFISANGEPGARADAGIRKVAEWVKPIDAGEFVIPKILEALDASQPKPEADEKN